MEDENPFAPDEEPARGDHPASRAAASADAAPPSSAPESAEPDTGPLDPARLRRAWMNLLQDGQGIPAGMAAMLRAGKVSTGGGREIRIELPPGHPVVERLSQPAVRKTIEDSLGGRLGGPVTLAVATGPAAAAEPGAPRITADSARRDRLARMMDGEPVLTAAVQALDLEIVD
jgi:hypothetical protein